MRLQDRFQLFTSYALSTILALFISAAYLNQPLNAAGAFTRGSVIFVAMLSCALDTFGELPSQMLGRPILKKQISYRFYRPAAVAIANTVADIPFSAVRILIYDIIIYFMSDLSRNAGGFFSYHLFVSRYAFVLYVLGVYGIFCTDLCGVLDYARFLQDLRSHVHQLRCCFPSCNFLRS